MIEKLNIKIQSKDTKKIDYYLNLDNFFWSKAEYNDEGKRIYSDFETISGGFWFKEGYNSEGNRTYFETSEGYILDKR